MSLLRMQIAYSIRPKSRIEIDYSLHSMPKSKPTIRPIVQHFNIMQSVAVLH